MRTTGTRSEIARPTSSTPSTVAPRLSAAVPAAWITGPSASGSENGTPSSIRSAPDSAYPSPIRRDVSRSGKPPIRYGISAARRPSALAEANASAIRSSPLNELQRFLEVLVPPSRQTDQVELRVDVRAEHPGDCVRALERRDYALQRRQAREPRER